VLPLPVDDRVDPEAPVWVVPAAPDVPVEPPLALCWVASCFWAAVNAVA
jgi:hypothetical protein